VQPSIARKSPSRSVMSPRTHSTSGEFSGPPPVHPSPGGGSGLRSGPPAQGPDRRPRATRRFQQPGTDEPARPGQKNCLVHFTPSVAMRNAFTVTAPGNHFEGPRTDNLNKFLRAWQQGVVPVAAIDTHPAAD